MKLPPPRPHFGSLTESPWSHSHSYAPSEIQLKSSKSVRPDFNINWGTGSKPKTGSLRLYIILAVVVVALMVCLRHCSAPRPQWDVAHTRPGGDTVHVAIEYSPLAVMSLGGDSLGGFGYEMMNQVARLNGLDMVFHPIVRLQRALEQLDSGFYDVVIAELPATAEFAERIRFSSPVFIDRQVLIQHCDSAGVPAITSQLQLGGKTVTLVAGSPAAHRIRSLSREIGDSIIIAPDSVHSPEQIFLLTAAGEIPLAVINASTARAMAPDYPQVNISTAVSFSQFRAWALTKQRPAVADTIDAALQRFMATPAYRRLLDRYGLAAPSK